MMKIKYANDNKIWNLVESCGVPLLKSPLLEETGVVTHGFSTKLGGVSQGACSTMNISMTRGDDPKAVDENRRRLAAALGTKEERMVYTQQTHTTNVAVVTADDCGRILPETDGMITNVLGVCLVTFYADCVPLFFVDPVHCAIGLSHSGWRGTVHKMAGATVRKMQEVYGTDPKDLFALSGPSICQSCYEVSEDVIDEFRAQYEEKDWDSLFYKKENGKYQLNLWRANEINFLEAGILKEHLQVNNLCTCCNHELLFSHRYTAGKRGNLSAFLELRES